MLSISTSSPAIAYGNAISVDLEKCPPATVHKFLTSGVAHVFGNEAASRVTSWEKGLIAEAVKALGDKPSDEAIKEATVAATPTEAQKAAKKAEVQAEMLADAYSGELGVSNRGPRKDPMEAALEDIALRNVRAILAAQKGADGKALKMPKTDDEKIVFANGTTRTKPEMVANWLRNNADSARKEAEKKVADDARKAAAAKDKADKLAAQGPADPDAIGI